MTPYYQDDAVTIYHGDARDVLPLVTADVLVTDPPYGIAWRVNDGSVGRAGRERTRKMRGFAYPPVHGDDAEFDVTPLLSLGLPSVIFGANHFAGMPASPSWIVWDKRPSGYVNDQADAELAWTNLGGPVRVYRQAWSGGGTLRAENGTEPVMRAVVALHPTQKPIGLMRWIIERCPEGVILDPFMGSGTTLRAAKDLGRRAIGIEIEERYCEIAARRCSQEVLGLVG